MTAKKTTVPTKKQAASEIARRIMRAVRSMNAPGTPMKVQKTDEGIVKAAWKEAQERGLMTDVENYLDKHAKGY